MLQTRSLRLIAFAMFLMASACGGADNDPPETADPVSVEAEAGSGITTPAAEDSPDQSEPGADGDESEPDLDQSATDDPAPTAAEDEVQTTSTVTRDGYDVVTISPANDGKDVTFAVVAPTIYDEATCRALDAWHSAYRDGFAYAMEPGTSLDRLVTSADRLRQVAPGEVAIFFDEWTKNVGRQQAEVDAGGSADLSQETDERVRLIEAELRVFDESAHSERERHFCGPARSSVVRPDPFEDVVFEAPDAIAYTDGHAVQYETIELSGVSIEASWVDPRHTLGLQDEYRVTQNPWVTVNLTATNGDSAYEWNSLTPVQLVGPGGVSIRETSLFESGDPDDPGRPFESGEIRDITFAFEVDFGYLQPDGLRQLPVGVTDWAARFNSSGSWTYVELNGRVARGVINGSGAPWPDIDPSFYDDAETSAGEAAADEPVDEGPATSAELRPEDQAEIDVALELFEEQWALDEAEIACLRAELERAFLEIDPDAVTGDDFLAIYTACDLQRKVLRSNLGFIFPDVTVNCVYEAASNDDAEAFLSSLEDLAGRAELEAAITEFVASMGCS